MNSIRLLITENCNANCPNCFNKDYRTKRDMDYSQCISLLSYLSKSGLKKVKLMGGEPTVHPFFSDILKFAQSKFDSVIIFTNAINDEILKINLREKDLIVYNSQFIDDSFPLEKLLPNQAGTRVFETQISSDLNVDTLISRFDNFLSRLEKEYPHDYLIKLIGFNLTLNCMENIFAKKSSIIKKWNKVYDFIKKKNYDVDIDHSIPWCFFVNTNMKVKQGIWKCTSQCSGLIDSEMNLRYCNQHPKVLMPLIENGKFTPVAKIENYLYMENLNKIHTNLVKLCKDCPFFNRKCNGGCFMHKNFISSNDVILNTNLPKKE